MNFDEINAVSDYVRNQILPHCKNRVAVPDFTSYLSGMTFTKQGRWIRKEMKIFPLSYLVKPEAFVEAHEAKCVAYLATTNPQDGAFTIIYQISPTMHILARLYHWMENDVLQAYLAITCAYRTDEDYLEFFDNNKQFRLTGDTGSKVGFASAFQSNGTTSATGSLFERFAQQAKEAERNGKGKGGEKA